MWGALVQAILPILLNKLGDKNKKKKISSEDIGQAVQNYQSQKPSDGSSGLNMSKTSFSSVMGTMNGGPPTKQMPY